MALLETLEVLETFYAKLETDSVVVASLSFFCPCLAEILAPRPSSTATKFSSKITVKSEKVVVQLLSTLESLSTVSFDEELLAKMEILLTKTLTCSRKQLRGRVAQFWNRTFGKKATVTYSVALKEVLTKHQMKLNLLLPGLKEKSNSNMLTSSQIEGASLFMDDTAQFPDDSMPPVSSPSKLKHVSNPSTSPVKIHGSFLGSLSNSKKNKTSLSGKLSSPSNVLGNFLASSSVKSSPKSPFKKNSPASAGKNVRRKLPIGAASVMEDASCDFVEIKDSPATTKRKRRLLTEHQKEKRHERRAEYLPTMYNTLDNSQDTTVMRNAQLFASQMSQDATQMSQDTFFELPEKEVSSADVAPEGDQTINECHGRQTLYPNCSKEKTESPLPATLIASRQQKVTGFLSNKSECLVTEATEEVEDIIPSSQTQQDHITETSSSSQGDSQQQRPLSSGNRRRKSMLKSKATTNKPDSTSALMGLSQVLPSNSTSDAKMRDAGGSTVVKTKETVEDSNIVLLSEDVELFDAPFTTKQIEDSTFSISNSSAEDATFNPTKNGPLSILSTTEVTPPDSPKQDLSQQQLLPIDMGAKIVVDKLPNKRKRTLPTARRTGHKKRKVVDGVVTANDVDDVDGLPMGDSKENKIPPLKRSRRHSVAAVMVSLLEFIFIYHSMNHNLKCLFKIRSICDMPNYA